MFYVGILFALHLNSGCEQDVRVDVETSAKANATARATEHLELLRAKNWRASAGYILVALPDNEKGPYRKRFLPFDDLAESKISNEVIGILRSTYSTVSPGNLDSVRITEVEGSVNYSDKGPWAKVSYRHGDIDGFTMRLFNDKWYRIMEIYPSILD
jgi:hypothetical protein